MYTAWDIARGLIALVVGIGLVGWFIVWTVRKAEDPARRIFHWVLTFPLLALIALAVPIFGVVGPFVIVFCAVVLSIIWTPSLATWVFRPVFSLFDGGSEPPIPRPAYSVALARQKQGKPLEAVVEIRKQLDRFPTDFEGHFLLARIQAEDLEDLPAAEATIERLCQQPRHLPAQIISALYALADWHLKMEQDVEAARRALQKVMDLYPDTEFSNGAAQRIAHLTSKEALQAGLDPCRIAVPEGIHNLGLRKGPSPVQAPGHIA